MTDPDPATTAEALTSVYGQLMVLSASGRLSADQMRALRELDGTLLAIETAMTGTPVGAGAHSAVCGIVLNAYVAGQAEARADERQRIRHLAERVHARHCLACEASDRDRTKEHPLVHELPLRGTFADLLDGDTDEL